MGHAGEVGVGRAEVGDAAERFGFDEHAGEALLTAALGSLGRPVDVTVRPHPREPAGRYAAVVTALAGISQVTAQEDAHGDRFDAVRRADVVAGMTSMLLREAALIGRPVVSLQPGRRGPTDVIDGDPSIRVVSDVAAAAVALVEEGASQAPASRPSVARFLSLLASAQGVA